MNKYYVLYNPKACSGNCYENVKPLSVLLEGDVEFINLLNVKSYERLFNNLDLNIKIVLAGGDGTLNRFINEIKNLNVKNQLYYYPAGTGNDFYKEVNKGGQELISLDKYVTNLPIVTVKNEKRYFINGVGYGIDGFCCEEGDKLALKGKKVNYVAIAIKGLLYKYKPTDAVITVDGQRHEFKKVWLAPTMFGKYYGGGMIPAPNQNRDNQDKKVSVMVFYGSGKLRTLMIFPKIFKGEHVNSSKYVKVFSGNNIEVEFLRKTPLQIDGETVKDVSSYKVSI
ncbi:MAG: diacylglycerol kinase family protein [Clostridia bacterium]|nr:diacylglycerol kinase family protein [Clostridia bacterium]